MNQNNPKLLKFIKLKREGMFFKISAKLSVNDCWDYKNLKNSKSNFWNTVLPYLALLFIQLAFLLFQKQSSAHDLAVLLAAVKKSLPSLKSRAEQDIQIHFLYGLPMNDLVEDLVLFISHISDLPSDCYCTLLQGTQKRLPLNFKSNQFDLTIDDDIINIFRSITDKLTKLNSMTSSQAQTSSIYRNYDDSFTEIKCRRKSSYLKSAYEKYKKPWHLHLLFILFYFFIAIIVNLKKQIDDNVINHISSNQLCNQNCKLMTKIHYDETVILDQNEKFKVNNISDDNINIEVKSLDKYFFESFSDFQYFYTHFAYHNIIKNLPGFWDPQIFDIVNFVLFWIFYIHFCWLAYHFLLFTVKRLYFTLSISKLYFTYDTVTRKQIHNLILIPTSLFILSIYFISSTQESTCGSCEWVMRVYNHISCYVYKMLF